LAVFFVYRLPDVLTINKKENTS